MRKHLSKALALALAMSSLASVSLAEGSVLNVWCWNDEFQSRFNAYYPEVKEVAEDKSTTTRTTAPSSSGRSTRTPTTTTRTSWMRLCSSGVRRR
ncbi:MAG: hypothetical protein ACLTV6_13875 [Christensenellales bacterium]